MMNIHDRIIDLEKDIQEKTYRYDKLKRIEKEKVAKYYSFISRIHDIIKTQTLIVHEKGNHEENLIILKNKIKGLLDG